MTVEEFNQWIDSVVPDGFDCGVCGRRSWIYMGEIATRALEEGVVDPDAGYPLVGIACGVCGSVEAFSRQVISGAHAT